MKYVAAPLILALLLVSCSSGSDSNVLHMRGYDISPDGYRTMVRTSMTTEGPSWSAICRQVKGLPLNQANEYLNALLAPTPGSTVTSELPRNSTPRAGQTPYPASLNGATKIIQQECERTF